MDSLNSVKYVTREISPDNQADVKTITQMHLNLLSWGPLANLGSIFLQRFCYTVLIRDDQMRAALCFVNDQPAGFVAYTAHSFTFHRTAINKHWPLVTYLAFLSILNKPAIFLRLIKAVRLMISRRTEKEDLSHPTAEILAIGVLPEFRSPQFIYKTGLRISYELFMHVVKYFKNLGLTKMRLAVDSFNKQTLFFYHGLGGRFGERPKRAGDQMVQIWFDLDHLSI